MPAYQPPCVHIYMPDGKVEKALRFSPLGTPGIADFKAMYQEMVRIFVKYNASLGDILCDPEGIQVLQDMASIIPVGEGKSGVDISALLEAGDLEQVCTLFITSSMQRDGKHRGEYRADPNDPNKQLPYEPGELARLNQLDFFGYVAQELKKAQEESEEMKAQINAAIAKATANGSSDKPLAVEIAK